MLLADAVSPRSHYRLCRSLRWSAFADVSPSCCLASGDLPPASNLVCSLHPLCSRLHNTQEDAVEATAVVVVVVAEAAAVGGVAVAVARVVSECVRRLPPCCY